MSLYDNIRLSNSQYIPKFIGSNYEALDEAGKTLDERYRRNQELTDKVAIALSNLQIGKGDESLRKSAIDKLRNDIDIISSSPENFENSTTAVAKAARDFATNEDLILAQQNYQRAEQARQMALKLGNQGYNFGDDFDNYSSIDPNTGERRIFKNDVRQLLDYDKKKEEFFNQIAANEDFKKLGQSGVAGILSRISTGGISAGDIKDNFLGPALTRYRTTSEYQQEFEKLKKENPSLSNSEIESGIVGSLLATGLERVFKRKDVKDLQDPLSLISARQNPNYESTFTGTAPAHPAENNVIRPLRTSSDTQRDMTPEELRDYYKKNPQKAYGNPGVGGYNAPPQKVTIPGVAESDPSNYTYQFNHIIEDSSDALKSTMQEAYGKRFDKEKYQKEHEAMVKNLGKVTPLGINIATEQAKDYSDFIYSNPSSPVVMEGQADVRTLKDVIANDYKEDDKIEVKASKVVPSTPNKDFKGGLEFTIYKNGKPDKSGFMRINDQYDEAVNVIDDINKNSFYQGSDTYTKQSPRIAEEYTFRDANGNLAAPAFYTVTIPVGGKPKTFVYTGIQQVDIAPDGNGYVKVGEPNFPEQKGQSIQSWNSIIYEKYVRPRTRNILMSGQPSNSKDNKDYFDEFN